MERAREKRRGKRAISEKQNREIQIQKRVSGIRGRSCKCKRLKVGLDFRYPHRNITRSMSSTSTRLSSIRTIALLNSLGQTNLRKIRPSFRDWPFGLFRRINLI